MFYWNIIIVFLLISLQQFNWSQCDGISSILFPFNTVVDQSLDNKNQERNLSLRNRYQPNFSSTSSTNPDLKASIYSSPNLLNKLTLDKQNPRNNDRGIVVPDLYCEKEEWLCHDKLRCIQRSDLCNKVQDCIDSSDEIGCIGNCRGDEFKCANQKCISNKFICDTFDDCGDWSDEITCIGTGKIPRLTGNLKQDLDSFESIESQNLYFKPPKHYSNNKPLTSQTDPNHPNKHPDTFNTFNSQINKQQNSHPNREPNQNSHMSTSTTATTTPSPPSSTSQPTSSTTKATSINESISKSSNKKPENSSNQTATNYEAPYVKIFPLTPLVKNTEPAPNRIAYNNYAILTNKLVNSTDKNDKNLMESLGFGALNNKSIDTLKQEVQTTPGKTMKLGQSKEDNKQANVQPISKMQNKITPTPNSNAQALSGLELANEKKSQPKANTQIDKNNASKIVHHQQAALNQTTSIDVSKSNANGPRLAFFLPRAKTKSEPADQKQNTTSQPGHNNNRKNKNNKDSKDDKKLGCKRNPHIEACKHCYYGLFRCFSGKCVITSFDCSMNTTTPTKGRRVQVNVNDFLQFV